MIITITGTPGVGKTYVAKKLAGKNFIYIDLNKIIKEEKLYDSYDRKAKTYDVDAETLKKLDSVYEEFKDDKQSKDKKNKKIKLQKIQKTTELTLTQLKNRLKNKKGIIIDSHLSHHFDSDICVVVKSDIKTINTRLKKRDYPKQKIKDNLESEIFDVCLEEAKNLKRNIVIIKNG
jgi:adenylate kinase